MEFGDKLKEIRKNEGISQEQLAEKIGVSRQAITKWETGKGMPDIENMIIISEIFKTTLDDLIHNEVIRQSQNIKKFQSETIYDIDGPMHIDMHLISAGQIHISTNENEKLQVCLESDTIENLASILKVKLDEERSRLDVECVKKASISAKQLQNELIIRISLPANLCNHCEVEAQTNALYLENLALERLEYDGVAKNIEIHQCKGSIEINGKTDCEIAVDEINGRLEVCLIKANSVVHIPKDCEFHVKNAGRKTNIFWQQGNEKCEPMEVPDSINELMFNGSHSELIIDIR